VTLTVGQPVVARGSTVNPPRGLYIW